MKKIFNSNLELVEPSIEFEIDGDQFTAIPASRLPGGALDRYFKAVSAGDIFEAHHDFFQVVLDKKSYDLFVERFNSTERPITLQMLGEVSGWLLGEEYMSGGSGNGVTPAEVPSSTGPAPRKSGRSSTAGAARKV